MKPSLIIRICMGAGLLGVFLYELGLSSFAVAKAAFARNPKIDSAIIAVPIELKHDFSIAVLANLITLTPGTCSLHVSDDKRTIYIHVLDTDDHAAVIAGIKSAFENRLRKIEG